MSNLSRRVLESLRNAERDLLNILAEAAASADYDGIDISRTAAARIRHLIKELTLTPARKAKEKKRSYPKFFVEDGTLFKEAWSKKEQKAYRHKVPEASYRRVIQALDKFSGTPTAVKAESLLEDPGLFEETTVPSYQTYVVLAFLRSTGVIRKVGHEGYIVPMDVSRKAEEVWANSRESGWQNDGEADS